MKVTVLGSAAAECIPALFCNCPTCRKAAEKGGKDIRTRAQVLVNEDLMIDWPADAYLHKLQSGADFSKIETLLVTHSHSDHFRPLDLCLRGSVFAHGMSCEKLRIYCSEGVRRAFALGEETEPFIASVRAALEFVTPEPLKLFRAGAYDVCAFRAQHMKSEQAHYYYVRERATGKSLLQAFDTGRIYPETYDFMEENGLRADVVLLDCTMLAHEIDENSTHMNIKACVTAAETLKKRNLLSAGAHVFVTHFSHNGGMLHEDIERALAPYGLDVAYDGMAAEV